MVGRRWAKSALPDEAGVFILRAAAVYPNPVSRIAGLNLKPILITLDRAVSLLIEISSGTRGDARAELARRR